MKDNKYASSSEGHLNASKTVSKFAGYLIFALRSYLSSKRVKRGESLQSGVLAGIIRIGALVGEPIEFSMLVSN